MLKPANLADVMAKAQLFEDRHDDLLSRSQFNDSRPIFPARTLHFTPEARSFHRPPGITELCHLEATRFPLYLHILFWLRNFLHLN